MTETNWLPGLVVLGVSAVAGLALVMRRGAPLPAQTHTRHEELLRQKDAAYTLLREHVTARVDTPEWEAERAKLEIAAARVLRALDEAGGGEAPERASEAPRAAAAAPAGNPKLVGAMWGVGVSVFAGGIAYLVTESATPRPEGAPATGGASGMVGAPNDAALDSLRSAVAADPTDIVSRNRLGHAALSTGSTMEAYKLSEEVLKLDPNDPEARTHQGIVLLNMGDVGIAAKVLDRVLTASPEFTEALMWRGAVHMQAGEGLQAADVWTRAVAIDPSLTRSLEPLIAEAKGAPAATPSGSAAPAAPAAGKAAAAASPDDITGTVTWDAAAFPPGATLFLSARAEGVTGGPPVWAQKLSPKGLPVDFRIGPADQMMPGETPAALVLTARLDRDGNAATREAGAPEARSTTLAPGTTGVVLRLEGE